MITTVQKTIALEFAKNLVDENYHLAYAILSKNLQAQMTVENLQTNFKEMINPDFGSVDLIELDESQNWDFLYVVLGGDIYSEAIFIHSWVIEDNQPKIDNFDFGRP